MSDDLRPRLLLLAAGGALLALAVALQPPPPRAASPLEALGRSLGGWRVAAVDVLALRAEALRRQGRGEEVPALYETMVGLDPDNAAAAEALADLIATQGVASAATDAQRLERWLDAWRLVETSQRAHPTSALLAMRGGLLLLEAAEQTPTLAFAVDARMGGTAAREALGLVLLHTAARAQEHLPRTGRAHLVALAREGPRLAARALARGQPDGEVRACVGAALDLLRLYPEVVRDVEEVDDPTPEHPEGRRVTLAQRLEATRELFDAALAAREAGRPASLAPALATFQARAGSSPASRALEAWSRR